MLRSGCSSMYTCVERMFFAFILPFYPLVLLLPHPPTYPLLFGFVRRFCVAVDVYLSCVMPVLIVIMCRPRGFVYSTRGFRVFFYRSASPVQGADSLYCQGAVCWGS